MALIKSKQNFSGSLECPGCKRQLGMGIVEVIAALVILSLALIPLLDVTQRLQSQAVAVEDRQVRAEAVQSALSYFRTVNVGETPIGGVDFGGWALRWDAKLVDEKAAFIQSRGEYRTPRQIGLFAVEIELSYPLNGQLRNVEYTTRAVGWSDTGSFDTVP